VVFFLFFLKADEKDEDKRVKRDFALLLFEVFDSFIHRTNNNNNNNNNSDEE